MIHKFFRDNCIFEINHQHRNQFVEPFFICHNLLGLGVVFAKLIAEELKHMLYALQDPALAHDEEKCNALMIRYNDLRGIQSIMAKRLGDRVVLR